MDRNDVWASVSLIKNLYVVLTQDRGSPFCLMNFVHNRKENLRPIKMKLNAISSHSVKHYLMDIWSIKHIVTLKKFAYLCVLKASTMKPVLVFCDVEKQMLAKENKRLEILMEKVGSCDSMFTFFCSFNKDYLREIKHFNVGQRRKFRVIQKIRQTL